MLTKSPTKVASQYSCNICYYNTSKKGDYNKHLLTAKHKNLTIANKNVACCFICASCSKQYKSRVGLWSHNKKCFPAKTAEQTQPQISSEVLFNKTKNNPTFILDIIKENQEFKTLLLEQQKENKELMNKMVEITQQLTIPTTIINNSTTNNNNNNNTTNNSFNLHFFLNETCKDAMNIQDFLENIKITFEDLLTIGNTGFVNGLSDIFVKQLRDLEITKRPIHCTDAKRETIYFKEADEWNKDDKENNKMKNIIEKVEYKNVATLRDWCEDNPDSRVNNTPNNLLRDKIYLQTLQGDEKTRDKIIKNITKEVIVGRFDKESLRDSRLGSEGTPTEPPGGAKRRFSIDSPNGLSTENEK